MAIEDSKTLKTVRTEGKAQSCKAPGGCCWGCSTVRTAMTNTWSTTWASPPRRLGARGYICLRDCKTKPGALPITPLTFKRPLHLSRVCGPFFAGGNHTPIQWFYALMRPHSKRKRSHALTPLRGFPVEECGHNNSLALAIALSGGEGGKTKVQGAYENDFLSTDSHEKAMAIYAEHSEP